MSKAETASQAVKKLPLDRETLACPLEKYIGFYNEKRPHRALNMMTPLEKEHEYWSQEIKQ